MRKLVNRFLADEIRELGMWSMALLINTSTWEEMLENWRLVCLVFWDYGSVKDTSKTDRTHSQLLFKISSITNDPNSKQAIQGSKTIVTDIPDVYTFDDESALPSQRTTNASRVQRKQEGKGVTQARADRAVNISFLIKQLYCLLFYSDLRRRGRTQSDQQLVQTRSPKSVQWVHSSETKLSRKIDLECTVDERSSRLAHLHNAKLSAYDSDLVESIAT